MNNTDVLLLSALTNAHSLSRAPRLSVVRDLLGLQAQFSRNPELSLRLRAIPEPDVPWDDGLVKIWAHRSTMYVVRRDELGLYLSAAGFGGAFQDGWWGMTAAEQEKWAPVILDAVASGDNTREGLKRACIRSGMDENLLDRAFHGWGGLIKELVWRGKLVCGTGTDKRYFIPGELEWLDRDEARRILIRRYFAAFGPASRRDCAAFFGYPMRELKPLLDELIPQMEKLTVENAEYYFITPLPEGVLPPCVLLPGFDQIVMAYRDRARLVDPANARKLVNQAGIVFPAALLRGKVRAKWKLDGETVRVTPFERLYKKDETALRRAVRAELGVCDVVFEGEV